jgi:hypothetical protein
MPPPEIDLPAKHPVADRCATERRLDGADCKAVIIMFADRQADAVHGDTLAVDQAGVRGADVQLASGRPVRDRPGGTHFVDQVREHCLKIACRRPSAIESGQRGEGMDDEGIGMARRQNPRPASGPWSSFVSSCRLP